MSRRINGIVVVVVFTAVAIYCISMIIVILCGIRTIAYACVLNA